MQTYIKVHTEGKKLNALLEKFDFFQEIFLCRISNLCNSNVPRVVISKFAALLLVGLIKLSCTQCYIRLLIPPLHGTCYTYLAFNIVFSFLPSPTTTLVTLD